MKKFVIGTLAVGMVGGAVAFVMMNKKARQKAASMLEMSIDNAKEYFSDDM